MFTNRYIRMIYNYIQKHDGEIILIYEMSEALQITQPTIRKYLHWLIDRNLIRRYKKRFWIIPI